jgi:hypothetical protein
LLTAYQQGPYLALPEPGYLVWFPSVARVASIVSTPGSGESVDSNGKVLGYLDQTGELRDGRDQLVGFVWTDEKVYLAGPTPAHEVYSTGQVLFFPMAELEGGKTASIDLFKPHSAAGHVEEDSKLQIWGFGDGDDTTVHWIPGVETCSIDKTRLVHLNGTPLELWEWDRINRFIRLFKVMQAFEWTITELDTALAAAKPGTVGSGGTTGDPPGGTTNGGFSFSNLKDKPCGNETPGSHDGGDDGGDSGGDEPGVSPCDRSNYLEITPDFIGQLMSTQKLLRHTGLELSKLLCLWVDIDTFEKTSLYSQLFLTHDLESLDNVFVPDANGNYLTAEPEIGDHVQVLVAAFHIKAEFFDAILERVNLTRQSKITISSLSKLYRHVLLSRLLGVRPDGLLDVLDLFPKPYESPSVTLDLVLLWERISNASFTVKQLRYIILNADNPLRPIAPNKFQVLRAAKNIVDGLIAIDISNADLTESELDVVTSAQVRAKALLIFDPAVVEDVLGLIEGTKIFTTNAPSGLVVDATKAPTKLAYRDSLAPQNRRATLSVTGCLTDAEIAAAAGLFLGNSDWSAALARLKTQAVRLVKQNLGRVVGDDELDSATEILTQGDVPATTEENTNPGTAPTKRAYFMTRFMPYLRSYLYTKLVTRTMSAATSLSNDICAWLLQDVIRIDIGAGKQSAMDVLVGLKSSAPAAPGGTWTGYLLPPSTATYVFYGYGDTQPPPLILNGVSVAFDNRNEDPNNLWWTGPVKLIGGRTVKLSVTGQMVPGDLQWKTERSAATQIPSSAMMPDTSLSHGTAVFEALSKASIVALGFSLGLEEAQYFQAHGSDFADLDFGHISLGAWKRLLAYYELRKTLVSREKGLIDLFKWANLRDTATTGEISTVVSEVTTWDVDTIKSLIDATNFDLGDVKLFRDEVALTQLRKAMVFTQTVGIKDINLLISWTDLALNFDSTWTLAKNIRKTIRGKYTASDFEQAIKPSHDQLRRNQRDELITYLVIQPSLRAWGAVDADSLFEFFLLDVQMGACMQTSRTKQAISSVQLFVQRCFLGLEKKGAENIVLDEERWKWMSKQTVSSANKKVLLWPENWLVSSLRDKKTPVYRDMESTLMQRDVKPENILESFRGYVDGLAQVARLHAVGLYLDNKSLTDAGKYVLHCVAMTAGAPYLFFHRTYDSGLREWSPWIRITVDIPTYTVEWQEDRSPVPRLRLELDAGQDSSNQTFRSHSGCYVTPVGWKSRTLVFIGTLTKKTIPNDTATTKPFREFTTSSSSESADTMNPGEAWEIKLAWTEYRAGKWTQKRTSSDAFLTVDTMLRSRPSPTMEPSVPEQIIYERYFLQPVDSFLFLPFIDTANGSVRIEVWYYASFWTVTQDKGTPAPSPPQPIPAATVQYAGAYVFDGSQLFQSRDHTAQSPTHISQLSFHVRNGREDDRVLQSLQVADGESGPVLPYVGERSDGKYQMPNVSYAQDAAGLVTYVDGTTDLFYHPFPHNLVTAASSATEDSGVEPIEKLYRQPALTLDNVIPVFGTGDPPSSSDWDRADGWTATFAELSKPYSQYNWEIGFHGPMQVADALAKSQQFDDALAMMHQVFNPHAQGTDIRKVWKWMPFEHSTTSRVLEGILNSLSPRQHDERITEWRDAPFRPYVVARGRIVAYMKWTVALYIRTLVADGDVYFRRRTLEDVPLAIQRYVLASHAFGPKGETIPKQGKKMPQTYFSLLDKWDALSNAAVQLEVAFPFSNQTGEMWHAMGDASQARKMWYESEKCGWHGGNWEQQVGLANIFGFATSRYFCLPNNPELQAIRSTIDQRLYNIRNCLDIDGRPMPLALWEPPIDPGQLVAAVASGLSLSSALNDLNASLPNYRFAWLLSRALDATAELKGLESTFLSIKEKRDGEALQLLRTGHEITMNNMIMELKKSSLEEAERTLTALRASQEVSSLSILQVV